MDYKKCWNKLKDKMTDIITEADEEEDSWIRCYTADVLLTIMEEIEKEVQEND